MRAWLWMVVALVLPSGCEAPPKSADRFPPNATAVTGPRWSSDGVRVRFDRAHTPVFQAPDGTRHRIDSLLMVRRTMAFGTSTWNDPGGPGPVWFRVDLGRQILSVFRGGDEIGTAVIVYGSDGLETPSGSFSIRGRERFHRSGAYDADMPFTLWLTADGVAIHASAVEQGHATHGCIGVPIDFAAKTFAVARRGDRVFILRGAAT